MINLRQAQAGNPLGFFDSPQPADLSVALYDAATRLWNVGPVPNLYGNFDFIIASRQDLVDVVAPVAGVFTLPNGSYAQIAAVALNAGERIVVPAGGEVYWHGFGADEFLDLSPGGSDFSWTAEGTLVLVDVAFRVNAANSLGIRVGAAGQLTVRGGDLISTNSTGSLALQFAGGLNFITNLDIDGVWSTGISTLAGQTVMVGGRVNTANNCLTDGAADGFKAFGTQFSSANASCLASSTAAAEWDLFGCRMTRAGAPASVVQVGDQARLNFVGCDFRGVSNDAGIDIGGDITEGVFVHDCRFSALEEGILYASGTVDVCQVSGSRFEADVTTGIDWPAANIPTDGLLVVGNRYAGTNALANHATNDTDVNYKCNSHNGALLTETAIVP